MPWKERNDWTTVSGKKGGHESKAWTDAELPAWHAEHENPKQALDHIVKAFGELAKAHRSFEVPLADKRQESEAKATS